MRRVVDGVTYNTDTATLIASTDYDKSENAGPRGTLALYQTRGGAFFVHDHEVLAYRDRRSGEWEERERDLVEPMSREEAQEWVLEQNVELHDTDAFGEPPEAAAESSPEATIYVRVPLTLKTRVDTQAKAEGLSVNSYVIRCLEKCASASAAQGAGINRLLLDYREVQVSTAHTTVRNALLPEPGSDLPALTTKKNRLLP